MPSFYRIDGEVQTPLGSAVEGASVAVLTQPANTSTQPGSPLATLYAAPSSNAASVSAASWTGQVINFTLSSVPSDLVVGSYIAVSGATPSGYNSTVQAPWLVTAINSLVVSVAALTNPGTYVSGGTVATSALPNPTASDGNGHYFAYLASGIYTLQIYGPTIVTQVYADQNVGFNNSGSVTSVALVMPAEFSVAGSPVTMSGTFTVTKANENANLVFAGPATGSPAAPTFRSLVSADLPASGGVTSVGLTATVPGILTQSVSGSPVTTSGTLGLTLGLATEPANTIWAGPAAGSPAAPTFRGLVPADLPSAFVPIQQYHSATLGADITAIAATTPTNVLSLSFTAPASGGPFRLLVFYNLHWQQNGGSGGMAANTWVSDGTNLYGGAQMAGRTDQNGIGGSDVSIVTYANGASITLNLVYEASQVSDVLKVMTNGGPNSYFRAIVFASN